MSYLVLDLIDTILTPQIKCGVILTNRVNVQTKLGFSSEIKTRLNVLITASNSMGNTYFRFCIFSASTSNLTQIMTENRDKMLNDESD